MNLTYFGLDGFVGVLSRLLEDGHKVDRIFTYRVENRWNFNTQLLELARVHRIPVTFGRPQAEALSHYEGCLLSASYRYRIPVAPQVRGVNLHPTLLPEGRGPWPLPYLIRCRSRREYAGLTLHKLTREFDAGDILAQRPIAVEDDDDLETLSAKLRLAAPDFVSEILRDFDRAWQDASPQGPGSYWPAPDMAMRTLSGQRTVAENLRVVRAFSDFEARVELGGKRFCVSSASGWDEPHNHEPGAVVLRHGHDWVMAVRDGYIVLRHPRPDQDVPSLRQVAGRMRRRVRRLVRVNRVRT